MGEFLSKIAERRTEPAAIAHRAAITLSDPHVRAMLVEGPDDVYFYSALMHRFRLENNFVFFTGGGRSKVIKILEILRSMGKNERSFGIIDRDFNFDDDSRVCEGRCLVLDVYSYENYFLDEKIMKRLGEAIFSLENGTEEYKQWTSMVEKFSGILPELFNNEMGTALYSKRRGLVCNLNNFKILRYVKFSDSGNVTLAEDFSRRFLDETSSNIPDSEEEKLVECIELVRRMPIASTLRGHYFWSLFVSLLNRFRLLLDNKLKLANLNRSRTRSDISEKHALESSIHFLVTPRIIEEFVLEIA